MNKIFIFFENNHSYYKININCYKKIYYFLKIVYIKYNELISYNKIS